MIKKDSLEKLFDKIKASGKIILAPKSNGKNLNFETVTSFSEIEKTDNYIQTTQSAKNVAFPRTETILKFRKERNSVAVTDFNPDLIPETVVWGVRPCDAAGINPLNAIFTWDSVDTMFTTRLKKTTIITFSCHASDDYCFCTSVGGNPGNSAGSDILLTQLINGEFLAEILTEKGKAIADMAPELFGSVPADAKEMNLAVVPVKFKHEEIRTKLKDFFERNVWDELASRCIGCGACAYVCPACACFDIQDESHGKNGERVRCWDSCGLSAFTVHTSGHNPRSSQHQRWRQRILHKFSYMPDRQNVFGCIGCGRCSRACPVDMNITEQLITISEVK